MSDSYKYHAIQLVAIKVLELSIKVNPDIDQDKIPENDSFNFWHTHNTYNSEEKTIALKVGVKIDEEDNSPFQLSVELIGVFTVDEDLFPIEHINQFARQNAPLILYPYLREHVYTLTNRAEYPSVMLPLFEVPAFKIASDQKT